MGYLDLFKTAFVVASGATIAYSGVKLIYNAVKKFLPTEAPKP
jgi:hypothetical protein